MSKHYLSVLASVIAIAAYLCGYYIASNTGFWKVGGLLYISGLLWFYVAWIVGISQLAFGLLQYIRNRRGLQPAVAGMLVLGAQGLMFGFGALGLYLSA